MPQETISIRNFGGMMTNPHKEDIPDNMAVYAYNLDPQSELGVLKGIEVSGNAYQAEDPAVDIPDVYEADWIKYEVSGSPKWDLIYIDTSDDDITAIEDFYNATVANRSLTDLLTTGNPRCIKTFNNQAQVGFGASAEPYLVHRLLTDKEFFNGGAGYTMAAGLYYHRGLCSLGSAYNSSPSINSATLGGAAGGYFQENILYAWRASLVFDGIQESELTTVAGTDIAAAGGETSCDVVIRFTNGVANFTNALWDRRITGVKLYRAESSDGTAANLGLYRLVDFIDINDASWVIGASHIDFTYADDGSYPAGGATYEEETGLPETITEVLTAFWVQYGINEVGGGYHWVANCGLSSLVTADVADWQRYLFRSKKFRPNMFDWTRDFLVLPEIPNALAWYNDRLYAFSENTTYRINPELLYIEDTYFGAGASHRQSVCVSEYGLYFCNLNGAYRIQDSGIEVISDPIAEVPRTENYIGWKAFALATAGANFDRVVIKAEVDKRLVLFAGATASNASDCLAFYIPTGQWYRLGLGSAAMAADSGYYSGKDGEVYISNATDSRRLFAGATYETTSWISKEFHLNEPSQNKSWNMIKWDGTAGTGTISVSYGTEGALPSTAATSGAYVNVYKKTFQVSLVTTGNALVDSIDIIVRRLFGKR